MTTREKLKIRVINLLFPGKEYSEEFIKYFTITIGIVMEAFMIFKIDEEVDVDRINKIYGFILRRDRRLTKENGQECTTEDQTDETIENIYELIK